MLLYENKYYLTKRLKHKNLSGHFNFLKMPLLFTFQNHLLNPENCIFYEFILFLQKDFNIFASFNFRMTIKIIWI